MLCQAIHPTLTPPARHLLRSYGFVVYADPAVTDIACAGLNGLRMGDRTLTVRRAQEGPPAPGLPQQAPGQAPATSLSAATRVVVLKEAITLEEIADAQVGGWGRLGAGCGRVLPRSGGLMKQNGSRIALSFTCRSAHHAGGSAVRRRPC
jgi:hypothetical protein